MPKKSTITPEPHPVLRDSTITEFCVRHDWSRSFSRQDGSESWSGPQRGDGLQFAAFVYCAPVIGARAAKGLRRASRYVRVMLERVYPAHIGAAARLFQKVRTQL